MPNAFTAETTAEEAAGDIDLSGKTVVLTGGSAGLGVETARVLAKRGAKIVSVVRDVMEGAADPVVKLDVPLTVDAGQGNNWAAAH